MNPNQGEGIDLVRTEGDEGPRHAADAGIGVSHEALDGPVGQDHGGATGEPTPETEGDWESDPPSAALAELFEIFDQMAAHWGRPLPFTGLLP